ncbi:ribonuclease H [Bifidobacterium thermophilum]|uniref:Ribonuclease H n=1 Tax=Bifidobacterium thermophilum TaxID=33905 RepID=A0A2N3QNZ2_9BIFI|nr:hypothetical protein [Bifidobacterium thermophilum]PKU92104.1 ribonuclease H [Bifidobacterium thermophilum]PKU93342.1 ribonuclease H [Bifidobacterium thermophilum]
MIHAEGNGVAQAMGWAWADENTHKYGGAPRGTVYLGALTGILQALRSHTGSQRLAIKTDCHQAIVAIEAARSGHKPTTPSSRKNFPLIQAVLDEISHHNAPVSFHDIDEETPVMALKTARLFAQQQLQTFVTNPKHAPTGIPRETMDVMIRRRLISKESIAKAQQNAKALNQQQTGKPARANKPTTKQNATKQNNKLTKQTETLPNVGKNNASTIRDGKTANDAVASRNNVTSSNVTSSAPAPIHAAHAASSQGSETPTPAPHQPNPALSEPAPKPVPEVPAPPRPRHAAVETEVDEPQESQLLELLHSTVRNLRSSAKALQATAQAYDSALKRAKDATPGLDGNPITPLAEKPLRKARKHTKAAALEYEKAAEELEQFLNSYGDTDSVSAQESLHAARWNQ